MQLAWLPILALGPLLIVVYFADKYISHKQHHKKSVRPIAESSSLDLLPSFAKTKRVNKILGIAEKTILILMLTTLLFIAARPQKQVAKINETESRDIVLCLDTSGSMTELIAPSLEVLRDIVASNPTDKYGIVFFQNTSYPVLPLTRDTVALNDTIDDMLDRLENDFNGVSSYGYQFDKGGGTDIGEGLYGCMRRFSDLDTERSRHIILVSDLYHNGTTDMDVAAQAVAQYNVNLQVIAANTFGFSVDDYPWLSRAGATTVKLDDNSGIGKVVDNIYKTILNRDEEQAHVNADNPNPYWVTFAVLSMMFVAVLALREDGRW